MYYLYGKRIDTMSRDELIKYLIAYGTSDRFAPGWRGTDRWKRRIQEGMSKCGGSHVGRAMVRSMSR